MTTNRFQHLNLTRILTTVFQILTSSLFLMPSAALAQKVGIENEYATAQFMDPNWGKRHVALAKELLGFVKSRFGDRGTIRTEPWKRKKDLNYSQVTYRDPEDRLWQITPEVVNTGGHDGLEFVSPPLDADQDALLEDILKGFKRSKKVMRGLRSANHMTVDVSPYVRDKSNVNDLVNLILTIENHWAEIYQVFDPIRYGTVINRFGIPLAVDQQDLLKELEALPANERSYDRVAGVFAKYAEREKSLRDPDGKDASRMWKYRAANYGKLFGLNGVDFLPVIEFRIGDLESGSRLRVKRAFIRALVNLRTLDRKFRAPFGMQALDVAGANNKLKSLAISSSTPWLESLGIGPLTFSRLARMSKESIQPRNFDLIDPNQPVEWNGKKATLGFETEFSEYYRGPMIIYGEDALGPKAPRFLDPEVTTEGTGNIEVKSFGGEWRISELVEQMNEMKSLLGDHLRGFHAHAFIPKEAIEGMGVAKFYAWMAMLNDAIFAWRLENKRTAYSLKGSTQGRLMFIPMQPGSGRGSVRVDVMANGDYDVEIRGYMQDQYRIGLALQKLFSVLKDPSLVDPIADQQIDLRVPRKTLLQALEDFAVRFGEKGLSQDEKSAVIEAITPMNVHHYLPLNGFERLDDLSDESKRKIRDANQEFLRKSLNFVRQAGREEIDTNELSKQLLFQIKSWAQAVGLADLLEKRLLGLKSAGESSFRNTMNTREALGSSDSSLGSLARHARNLLTEEGQARVRNSVLKESRNVDLERLISRKIPAADLTTGTYLNELMTLKLISLPLKKRLEIIDEILAYGDPKAIDDYKTLAADVLVASPEPAVITELERRFSSGKKHERAFVISAVQKSKNANTAKFAVDQLLKNRKGMDLDLGQALFSRLDPAAQKEVQRLPLSEDMMVFIQQANQIGFSYALRALHEGDEHLRAAVVDKAKGYYFHARDREILGPALMDPSARIRSTAASAFMVNDRWYGDDGKWLELGLRSKDAEVRRIAASGLKGVLLETLSPKSQNSIVSLFLELYQKSAGDLHLEMRNTIAGSAWKDQRMQKIVLKIVAESIASGERHPLLRSLRGATVAGAMELVLESLKKPDFRPGAILALGDRSDPESLRILNEIVDGRKTEERTLAIHSLGTRTEPEVLDKLIRLRRSKNDEIRDAAILASATIARKMLETNGTVARDRSAPLCRAAFNP